MKPRDTLRPHSGLDDARNIARIAIRLHELGATIDVTGGAMPPAPAPVC